MAISLGIYPIFRQTQMILFFSIPMVPFEISDLRTIRKKWPSDFDQKLHQQWILAVNLRKKSLSSLAETRETYGFSHGFFHAENPHQPGPVGARPKDTHGAL